MAPQVTRRIRQATGQRYIRGTNEVLSDLGFGPGPLVVPTAENQ
jgi:hypothetical protein